MASGFLRKCISAALVLAVGLAHVLLSGQETKEKAEPLAVIVNKKSKLTDLTKEELHLYFTLSKQFWPDGQRVVLLLRPNESVEQKILLKKVYKMTGQELRKHWVAKIFAGDIPAVPSIIKTSPAAIALVKKSEGAISVVRLNEVTEDVRVLTIAGKAPKDPDYSLIAD